MTWRLSSISATTSPCSGKAASWNRGRPSGCSRPQSILTPGPCWKPCPRPSRHGARALDHPSKPLLPWPTHLGDDHWHAPGALFFHFPPCLEKNIMMKRRTVLTHTATVAALATVPLAVSQRALAQGRKDAIVLGMALEPPGLDPTAGAASAIAEIVQYNILETLTKVNSDGKVTPLLAESWEISPDLKTYTFKLRKGVKFQNGE